MSDMMKKFEMNEEELVQAAGGNDGIDPQEQFKAYRQVQGLIKVGGNEYLAVRSEPAYSDSNIIGCLPEGSWVWAQNWDTNGYILVKAQCTEMMGFSGGLKIGYVNAAYLSK